MPTNKLPLISIVVPTYNSEKFLTECFDSIKKQTYSNLEVLIIDGGSTDSTIDIIRTYLSNKNWKLLRTQNGVSSQRNFGILNCSGEYITFIDSDDYINDCYIDELLKTMLSGDYDIVTPNIFSVPYDENGIIEIIKLNYRIRKEITKNNFFIDKYDSCLCGPTKLYKRSVIKNVMFPINVHMGEDYIFNYSIAKCNPFKFALSEKSNYYYRRNIALSGYEKRLNAKSTTYFNVFLNILKEVKINKDNYKCAYLILKENTNNIIEDFIKHKKRIPFNMHKVRWFFFFNDRSKKRFFYLFPKSYIRHLKQNDD